MRRRIAITGAAGLIGQVLTAGLDPRYDVCGLDRAWRTGLLRRREDVRNPADTARVFAGADTVIHLAAHPKPDEPWSNVEHGNVPATIAAYEAAVSAGVRRFVFASTGHVTGLYEREEPYASIVAGRYEGLDPAATPMITSSDPIRPNGPYAVSKAFGEAAGRYFSETYGLSVLCVRLGWVTRDSAPHGPQCYSTLLSHADLLHLIEACIEAPADLDYAVFFGVSANTWRYWDIEEPRNLIGFEPRDDAEAWRSGAPVAIRQS